MRLHPRLAVSVLAFACAASCASSGRAPQASAVVTFPVDEAPLVVEGSLRLAAGEVCRPAAEPGDWGDPRGAAVVVDGQRNVVVDLRGLVLHGQRPAGRPDERRGIGLLIRGCDSVRVLGGEIAGYRVPLCIVGSRNVVVDGTHCADWFAERLTSNARFAAPADGLSPVEEEPGAWFEEHGAAIGVLDSSGVVLRNCRGRGGQNGIVLSGARGTRISDCDFSFLSGWGLALTRSSGSVIQGCVFDACVRGYAHGEWSADHGAAGVLLGSEAHDNRFVDISATYGGSGFLLRGGAQPLRNNTFHRCDASLAVGSGFSINSASDTVLSDVRVRGALGAAITATTVERLSIVDARIETCREAGIVIAQGTQVFLARNRVHDSDRALELTGCAGSVAALGNVFGDNLQDVHVDDVLRLAVAENRFESPGGRLSVERVTEGGIAIAADRAAEFIAARGGMRPSGRLTDVALSELSAEEAARLVAASVAEGPRREARRTWLEDRGLESRGLEAIVIGEFGPWDWRSGGEGPRITSGGDLLSKLTFDCVWFRFTRAEDPRGDLDRWRALRYDPIVRAATVGLASPWGRADLERQIGREQFGLFARTRLNIAASGRYRLSALSDDGVRVTVDGATVLENWSWHPATRDAREIELSAGAHELEVEYFQLDGAAELVLDLERL